MDETKVAITNLWENFLSVPGTDLKTFCNELKNTDERFATTNLLAKFITYLEEKWDPTQDLEFKNAKSTLASLFKKEKEKMKKKVREIRRKEKNREALANAKEREESADVVKTFTPEELEANLNEKKMKILEKREAYLKRKEEKDAKNERIRELMKIDAANKNMAGQLKGIPIPK